MTDKSTLTYLRGLRDQTDERLDAFDDLLVIGEATNRALELASYVLDTLAQLAGLRLSPCGLLPKGNLLVRYLDTKRLCLLLLNVQPLPQLQHILAGVVCLFPYRE